MTSHQLLLTLLFTWLSCKVSSLNTRIEPPVLIKLSDAIECQDEIGQHCQTRKSNNYELLACLHDVPTQSKFSKPCQNIVWQFKSNLTRAVSFFINGISAQSCKSDINNIPDCKHEKDEKGPIVPCLLEFQDQVKNPTCKKYLNFLKPLIFSDYRLTYKLVDFCSDDIQKLHCGRINSESNPNDQGSTIDCLAESSDSLEAPCRREILKISELQSEDWNNDRPLFLACREDRDRLCPLVNSGTGLVYECLYKNKMHSEMSKKCREKLRLRQNLQNRDYSVDYKFATACTSEITLHSCDVQPTNGDQYMHTDLSKIILCLEDAKLSGKLVGIKCISQVKEVRYRLLEDHKINPEVLVYCKDEIKYCEERTRNQPFIIHCIMEATRKKASLKASLKSEVEVSSACSDAVENLLLRVDIGEELDVDPALLMDCNKEINDRCTHQQNGKESIMNCLMSLANQKGALHDKCLDRLMEIQFFLSRNFKISRRAVTLCKDDSKKNLCHTDLENSKPDEESHIISCLYRNRNEVARECLNELNKLMSNRAQSVDLPPKIQVSCMNDLIRYCPKETKRDEEMFCLEDNYDSLSIECKGKLLEELEKEEEMPTLNRIFVDSCKDFLKQNCFHNQTSSDNGPEGDSVAVMDCLIQHKDHSGMPKKCRIGIEHHQLMSMEEMDLSPTFRDSCDLDRSNMCPNSLLKMDIVRCLSVHVYNDTMLNVKARISKKCRKQLSTELQQIGENIKLDKELSRNCEEDRLRFCKEIDQRGGKVVECLREHQKELKMKCRELLFKREMLEGADASVDYTLMMKCKKMIQKYCKSEQGDVFKCLKEKRNEVDFDDRCHSVIVNRMRLKSHDIRLNPRLFSDCHKDIEKYCHKELDSAKHSPIEIEGVVIYCLRKTFVHKIHGRQMTSTCTNHISELIRESAIDYLQDPALVKNCKPLIELSCLKEAERHRMDEDGSEVYECLLNIFAVNSENAEKHFQCFNEVSRRLSESKLDIQIDPLLDRVCSIDAKTICRDYARGEGRVMSCLFSAMMETSIRMNPECRKSLKERFELWSLAIKIAPSENLIDLYEHIQSSSCRTTLAIFIFLLIAIIFSIGICFGRVTRKLRIKKRK